MEKQKPQGRRTLEIMLVVVVLGMTTLFVRMGEQRMLALNLFFLPVIISGYFLGRLSAGVLALFSSLAIVVTMIAWPQQHFGAFDSPITIGLAITIWSACLGLVATLIGTLCDERAVTVAELQRAYVGIAEVLSRYLHGSDPRSDTSAARVAKLSERIASELHLSAKHTDDIRVAALLHDLDSVEITTQVISRAMDTLGTNDHARRTFMGTDLMHSLGEVLHGALPLIVNQNDGVYSAMVSEGGTPEIPLGVHVIRAARSYDRLSRDTTGGQPHAPEAIVRIMRNEPGGTYQHVIDALERAVTPARSAATPSRRGAAALSASAN